MSILVEAYSTLRELPQLDFPHVLLQQQHRASPLFAMQVRRLIEYVMQSPGDKISTTQYHLYRHLQRSRHAVKLQIEAADAERFARWSELANAIGYLADGSIRDPQGRLLLDETDSPPDPASAIPFPPEAFDRRRLTLAELGTRGITVPSHLPPVVSEVEVELRPASEVARRMLALFVVALRAESLAAGDEISAAELRRQIPIGYEGLTPHERAFVEAAEPERQAVIEAAWRYESLEVLQWAIGHVDRLGFPAAICDVPAVARTAFALNHRQFVDEAQLRGTGEILDALDQTFRLHWAVRQAHQLEQPPPADLVLGVLFERHIALNWLTRFEEAAWDDVTAPT